MFMPFWENLSCLHGGLHRFLPADYRLTLSLSSDTIGDRPKHQNDTHKAEFSDGMGVHKAGNQRRQQDAHWHNDTENHRPEILDSVEDEYLPHRAKHDKENQV